MVLGDTGQSYTGKKLLYSEDRPTPLINVGNNGRKEIFLILLFHEFYSPHIPIKECHRCNTGTLPA